MGYMVNKSLLNFQASLFAEGIKTQIKEGIPDCYEYAITFDGADQPGSFLLGKINNNILVLHHRTGMESYDIKFKESILTLAYNPKFIQQLKHTLSKYQK